MIFIIYASSFNFGTLFAVMCFMNFILFVLDLFKFEQRMVLMIVNILSDIAPNLHLFTDIHASTVADLNSLIVPFICSHLRRRSLNLLRSLKESCYHCVRWVISADKPLYSHYTRTTTEAVGESRSSSSTYEVVSF